MEDLTKIDPTKMSCSEMKELRAECHTELATKYNEKVIRAKLIGEKPPEETERQRLLKSTIKKLDARMHKLFRENFEREKAKEEALKKEWEEEARRRASNPPILGPRFLKKGKRIGRRRSGNLWEVVSYDPEGDLVIRVLKAAPRFDTYLDVGETYTLFEHKHNRQPIDSPGEPMEIWEIPPEQMKRSTSQMLLYLWEEGPDIDLDF